MCCWTVPARKNIWQHYSEGFMQEHVRGHEIAQTTFQTERYAWWVAERRAPCVEAAAQADQVHVASLIQPAADEPMHFTICSVQIQ